MGNLGPVMRFTFKTAWEAIAGASGEEVEVAYLNWSQGLDAGAYTTWVARIANGAEITRHLYQKREWYTVRLVESKS